MNDDVLFECDFSIDELAVLADLLEIPALPGVDPEMEVPDEAKGAAARGLLARGVVVADSAKGTVEITQPYATMIGTVLFSTHVSIGEHALSYAGEHAAVRVRALGPLTSWQIVRDTASTDATVGAASGLNELLSVGPTAPSGTKR